MKSDTRTPNIRISVHTHTLLRRLAQEEGDSMRAVLDRAIESYRREKFLRDANADYAALKRDEKAWKEELRQRAIWKQTASDGLSRE